MFEARGPQGTIGCVAAQSPPRRELGSETIGYMVHQSPLNMFGATIHMAASKPFLSGRRNLEPLDTW
jgi:hypothetical protein